MKSPDMDALMQIIDAMKGIEAKKVAAFKEQKDKKPFLEVEEATEEEAKDLMSKE